MLFLEWCMLHWAVFFVCFVQIVLCAHNKCFFIPFHGQWIQGVFLAFPLLIVMWLFLPSLSCVLLQCYLAFKRMQCASQQPAILSSFLNDCIFQGYIFQLRLSLIFISCSGISFQGSRDFLPALTCRVVHFFFSCGIRVHLYTEKFMFFRTFFFLVLM